MLFPLYVTPFEQSLLVDDRPAYPWNIVSRLTLAGPLDRDALARAWMKALARQPMLRAKLVRRGRGVRWIEAEDSPPIRWNEHPRGAWPRMTHIDLFTRGPVDLWCTTEGEHTELTLHLHHVNTDGMGTVQFWGDLLALYAAECGHSVSPPPVEEKLLRRRDRYGLTVLRFLKYAPKLAIGILGAKDFMNRKAAECTPHQPVPFGDELPATYPAALTHVLTTEETTQALAAAKRAGVTLNDLLARDLFLALGAWRDARGLVDDQAWLRMMIPMNLRGPDDAAMPVANIMSTIFLDRQRPELAAPQTLLASIREQMNLIKNNRLALIWVIALKLVSFLPGQMQKQADGQGTVATTILTNLMRPFAALYLPRDAAQRVIAGGLTLERFEVYAPLRPGTCVTFGVATYAGRLHLCFQYDPRVLSQVEAEELLTRFAEQVRRSGNAAA